MYTMCIDVHAVLGYCIREFIKIIRGNDSLVILLLMFTFAGEMFRSRYGSYAGVAQAVSESNDQS